MTRSRGGFTFIEILTVIVVLGILSTIAAGRYIDLKDRAIASGLATELNGVRLAAYNYWSDHDGWPAEAASGVTPPELIPYLPRNFSFSKPEYEMDWENFLDPSGAAGAGNGVMQLGLTVTSTNARLMTELETAGDRGAPFFVIGNTLTYIILEPNGAM